jgi:CRP-like cAMP-binding protein
VSVTEQDLQKATNRLRSHPLDYGAWLEVAAMLVVLGTEEDKEAAFATIGEGARVGGQVALAIACGRHLAETGSVRGPELIEQVIDTFADKKKPPGTSWSSMPAARTEAPTASSSAGAPIVPEGSGTPLEEARVVVQKLGAWLAARTVPKAPIVPLLSSLTKGGARALVGVMSARAAPAGTIIIDIGEPATALYWLAHGTVTVARADGTELGELHSGAFFGEIALVSASKRTARVIAREDVWVLEIPARAIEQAAQRHPQLADVLAAHARQRLLANLVRTSELFRALDDDDRDELLAKLKTELVSAGTTFIHEGKANEHLWVVVAGRCEVRAGGAALAELGPGAAVGEISLVNDSPAVADVIALEPAVLLRLSRQDFEVVAKKHPALLKEVEKLVVARETANRAVFQDASDLIV